MVNSPNTALAVPTLGNTTESASQQPQNTKIEVVENAIVRRYYLQSHARKLLHKHRISACMRYPAYGQQNIVIQRHDVTGKTRYRGLMRCDSVWACPVCSTAIVERRKQEVYAAVAAAADAGLMPFMLTYTLSHRRADALAVTIERLLNSFRRIKSGRFSQQIREEYRIAGFIRALEITRTNANGWHPHVHELTFIAVDDDDEPEFIALQLERAVGAQWRHIVKQHGTYASAERGFTVRAGDSAVAEYVAKFGHEPAQSKWSLEAELVNYPRKTSRTERGRTPFALLADSAAGDASAGKFFVEYVTAMKGKAQLFWSPGLKDRFHIEEMTDSEIQDTEAERWAWLAVLSLEQWQHVIRADARGELLVLAQSHDESAIWRYVQNLGES